MQSSCLAKQACSTRGTAPCQSEFHAVSALSRWK